jgi:hypothetical protein
MVTVSLYPQVADQLQSEAERRQTSLEDLVNNWLEDQLWQERRKRIQEEAARFRAKHTELLNQYAGRYIAMRNGIVIDDDEDLLTLHNRIRARYGDEAILITPVRPEPVQTFKVLSSRKRKA